MQHMLKQLHHNQKGLTLVEVLAAMAILSIIVVAFLNISGYMTLAFGKSNEETEALRLAERILNERKNAIDTPPLKTEGTHSDTYPVDGYKVTVYETELNNSVPFILPTGTTKHVSVQAVVLLKDATDGDEKQKLLTVTVSWGEPTP